VFFEVVRPHYFPCRDFLLRGDGNLRRSLDTRRAATIQLRGSQAGQHRELERTDSVGTFDHSSLTSSKALVRALAGMAEDSEKRAAQYTPVALRKRVMLAKLS
jgi:hypothetical protein